MPNRYLFAPACLALLLALLPLELTAQRLLGVRWETPDGTEQARRELEAFHRIGITYLEIDRMLSPSVWAMIDELNFKTFGALPIRFPVAHTFSEPDSSFLDMMESLVRHYAGQESVQAIGLFQYGPVGDARFIEAVTPFIRQINNSFSGEIYYLTKPTDSFATGTLFDFKMISIKTTNGVRAFSNSDEAIYSYSPSEELKPYLTPVKHFLEETASVPAPVYFDSQWLLETLKVYPEFRQTIQLYASDPEPVFATPKEFIQTTSSHSLIVLLLVFVWGCFAVNYSFSPIFRRSMFRYFLGHKFYVDDIIQRHIRSMGPTGIMLLLHVILAGIAIYCYINAAFSDLAVEALSFHLPLSFLGGNFMASAVVGTSLATLAIEAICVIWLYLTNRRMRKLSQVVNLYAWPMQLNLLLVTVMVTLLMAGSHATLISVLATGVLLIFLGSFIITSLDTIKYVKNKYLYLAGTTFLYSTFWIALFIWLFNNTYLTDIYSLAQWLSQ